MVDVAKQPPMPRCLRDLLIAKADGQPVAEEHLRILRREDDLIRAALAAPRALAQSGVLPGMFRGRDYSIAWNAIEAALPNHVGDGSMREENVLAEMRRIDEAAFAGTIGVNWMAAMKAQSPVDVGYALDVLVPEVIAHHQVSVWNRRMTKLGERIGRDKDTLGLHQEFVTESYRIALTPDGGRLGVRTSDIVRDPRRASANLVPTGVPQIDRAAGGGHGRGEMMVVGAGTSCGKSFFAQRLLRNQARTSRASLYLSIEDPIELMDCRNVADYSSPAFQPVELRQGTVDPQAADRARQDMQREQRDRVYLVEAKKWKTQQICAAIRRHRYMADVDMVIVDYLQAIQPDEQAHNRTQEIAKMVADLKACATECGVALVLISQLAREEYRDGAEPTINSFKYAGDIENEAEIVMLMWRDDDDVLHVKLPKIKWAKARNLRYLIQTHEVTGCHGDWQDDFTPKAQPMPKRGQGRKGQGTAE